MQHSRRPAVTDRKVRFALAGCGRIASSHFDAISRHAGEAELAAVCDTDREALQDACRRTGAAGFERYDEMLG